MKSDHLYTVVTLASVFAAALLPHCTARPRSHLHHHNDRLPRIARATPVRSGNNLVEGQNDFCGEQ